MRAILTVIGKDKVGIIAKVSSVLAELEINILDIDQTVMQDEYFTMVMLVDLKTMTGEFSQVVSTLDALGEKIGMEIKIQKEEIFNSMHRI
jgi:ACT domain-containing protein